jgi:hypothetical protein
MTKQTITRIFGVTTALALAYVPASAQVLPRPRPAMPFVNQGGCPSSYYQSGSYCAPISRDALPAVPKPLGANCPSGWHQSGAACVKTSR